MTFNRGLLLIFIALKLSGAINWSWFFVFTPHIITVICGSYYVIKNEFDHVYYLRNWGRAIKTIFFIAMPIFE